MAGADALLLSTNLTVKKAARARKRRQPSGLVMLRSFVRLRSVSALAV